MKSYRKELWFNTPSRRAFINITPQVNEALHESTIQEGFVLVITSHNKKPPIKKILGRGLKFLVGVEPTIFTLTD